jgi:hypothetical protein
LAMSKFTSPLRGYRMHTSFAAVLRDAEVG